MLKVTKAVFPVAGLGTRFLPATKASPKEMLPIVDKPLIQYAVEEAIAAGITEMIFVTGRSKRAIEDHFDKSYEIEAELEARGKDQLLELVRGIKPANVDCFYVRQATALGLGHAVLCAEKLVGDSPFAVILADDLLHSTQPVMKQLVDELLHHWLRAVQQVVGENHRERAVAHQFLRAQHGVAEAEGRSLAHIEAIDISRLDAAHQFQQLVLAARFELCLDLVRLVEMVFNGALAAARYEDHLGDAGRYRLFHCILDQWLVDDGQHLLGACLGGRQEPCPETCHGKHGFGNFQHGMHSHIG